MTMIYRIMPDLDNDHLLLQTQIQAGMQTITQCRQRRHMREQKAALDDDDLDGGGDVRWNFPTTSH